jgi:hypothetical protein
LALLFRRQQAPVTRSPGHEKTSALAVALLRAGRCCDFSEPPIGSPFGWVGAVAGDLEYRELAYEGRTWIGCRPSSF